VPLVVRFGLVLRVSCVLCVCVWCVSRWGEGREGYRLLLLAAAAVMCCSARCRCSQRRCSAAWQCRPARGSNSGGLYGQAAAGDSGGGGGGGGASARPVVYACRSVGGCCTVYGVKKSKVEDESGRK
jgi:hypothetical protein